MSGLLLVMRRLQLKRKEIPHLGLTIKITTLLLTLKMTLKILIGSVIQPEDKLGFRMRTSESQDIAEVNQIVGTMV